MAKSPVAGAVKTRLCPPCMPEEAALLADAALADTLRAARAAAARRVVVALDGPPGEWLGPGIQWFAQEGDTFGSRLQHAWTRVGTPVFQIGMDTPQLTAADLNVALSAVAAGDAVLGPAVDGGWWGLGLRSAPVAALFDGIAMSTAATGQQQLARLRQLGRHVELLDIVRDVDTIDDARAVAAAAPETSFARTLARMGYAAA